MELSFSWKLALGGMPASPPHHLSLDPWDPGGKGEEGEKGCKGRPGGLSPLPFQRPPNSRALFALGSSSDD